MGHSGSLCHVKQACAHRGSGERRDRRRHSGLFPGRAYQPETGIDRNGHSGAGSPAERAKLEKLVAGLRFDGFEIVDTRTEIEPDYSWQDTKTATSIALVRMLPQDVPELDFREGESEVMLLLDRHGFTTSKGHLKQALAAFNRGE